VVGIINGVLAWMQQGASGGAEALA
jgi:hypothetical protein